MRISRAREAMGWRRGMIDTTQTRGMFSFLSSFGTSSTLFGTWTHCIGEHRVALPCG